MSSQTKESAPVPADWTAILDRIDARLHEAIKAAEERSPEPASPVEAVPGADRRAELERLGTRLKVMVDAEARAQVIVSEADREVATANEALQRFRADLESLRQRLEATVGRAIG